MAPGTSSSSTSMTPNWSAIFQRLAYGGYCGAGAGVNVALNHLLKVHAVHVVGADHNNNVRLGVDNEVHGLVNGVCAAKEPALTAPLLRGYGGNVIPQLC